MMNLHENFDESGKSPLSPSSSLDHNLRYLSKVILPPLGVSTFNDQTQIKSNTRIISPMDSKYRSWETLMVILVAYSAWVYPFEVAFLHNNITPKRQLYIVNYVVDFFFSIDIFLTFFVAYIDPITQLLVCDSRKIIKSYSFVSRIILGPPLKRPRIKKEHHKKLQDLRIGEIWLEGEEEEENTNMSINLLTVASKGNAAFLEELLKARLDPDIGDSKGKTPLHIAASKGHEECVLVLLKHGCNIQLRDMEGNTALWEAISSKHYSIFELLYHFAAISDPFTPGDLLCTSANKNDLIALQELLKHGLHVDSKNRNGQTAVQIATERNHVDMVKLLVFNGAEIDAEKLRKFDHPMNLCEMIQKREAGHQIHVGDSSLSEVVSMRNERQREDSNAGRPKGSHVTRVSIYRGHPMKRRERSLTQAGRLIKLPSSLLELKNIAGEKFGFDGRNASVVDEQGAEIDSIEVIRDNDKLYILEDQYAHM